MKVHFITRDKSFYKEFFSLLVFIALQNLIVYCVNLADNVMLGRWSEEALSGVALANQIQFLLQMIVSSVGEGVVVLVDLFGGTPSNSVCRMLGQKGVHAVSGVNLPMVLEGIFSRGEKTAEELAEYLAQVGPGAIFDIEKRLAQNAASRTEDEDDEDFE